MLELDRRGRGLAPQAGLPLRTQSIREFINQELIRRTDRLPLHSYQARTSCCLSRDQGLERRDVEFRQPRGWMAWHSGSGMGVAFVRESHFILLIQSSPTFGLLCSHVYHIDAGSEAEPNVRDFIGVATKD